MRLFSILFVLLIYFCGVPIEKLDAQNVSKSTIILVDDKHVLYRSGTKRVLTQLKRHEKNPVIAQTKPWETTISYCSIHRNEKTGKYQLWYQSVSDEGVYLSYATSDDGINWVKPNLELITYKDNKENNLVMRVDNGGSVIFDPREPDPERRYKSVFYDYKKPRGMGIAFSPDGIHWKKYMNNPVIRNSDGDHKQPPFEDEVTNEVGTPGSVSDALDLIWDPNRQVYAVYAKTQITGPKGNMKWKRAVVRTESKDFIHWEKPQLVMAADEFDARGKTILNPSGSGKGGRQFHNGPAFYYNKMYFSLLQVLDPAGTGNMPIELAISHDGYTWKRPFRNKYFLPPLKGETKFDASIIWSNATPIILKNEIRFYYGAYNTNWPTLKLPEFDYNNIISGIGLATIPCDRFAGVKPIDKIGQITFKAMDLTNIKAITLNANADDGAIHAELLNTDGYRIRGYSKDNGVVIKGDSLRHHVSWKNKDIRELPAGSYRIRLHMVNAEVFALSLKK